MVFAHFIRQRHREEGLQEGRKVGLEAGLKEGLKEGFKEGEQRRQQLWVEWNQRRLEAQENGRAFDEPPLASTGTMVQPATMSRVVQGLAADTEHRNI